MEAKRNGASLSPLVVRGVTKKTVGACGLRKPKFGCCGADLGPLSRQSFIQDLPLCQRNSSTWGRRGTVTVGPGTMASRGTGPLFSLPTTGATCAAPHRCLSARASNSINPIKHSFHKACLPYLGEVAEEVMTVLRPSGIRSCASRRVSLRFCLLAVLMQ